MEHPRRKRVLVTGATSGIGEATARLLLRTNYDVAALGRRRTRLEGLEAFGKAVGGAVLPLVCDLEDRSATDAALQGLLTEWPELFGVVANAGGTTATPLDAPTTLEFDRIVELNFTSHLRILRELCGRIADGGRIVAVASVLGRFGIPVYHAYCASKAALIGLARALALELAPRGITVNAVAPGWVGTPLAERAIAAQAGGMGLGPEEAKEAFLAQVPLRRMLRPEEVAHLVMELLGPACAGITGQAIDIDCGTTA